MSCSEAGRWTCSAPGGTANRICGRCRFRLTPRPGFYYVVARADWNALVGETSESNNDRASGTIKIGGDLVVASLSASTIGMANGPITVADTTTNSGTAQTPESATGFYLSVNTAYNSSDVFLGSRTVGALGPSQASSASTQVMIPAGTAAGNYFIIAFADWNGLQPEINETNNTRATISYLRVGPDVSISALTGPSSAAAGTSILVGDTTRNNGGDTMPASITSFYLSANFTIEATDVLLGSRPVPSLAPGASNSGSLSLLVPITGAGTYYIIAKADGSDATSEPQENNNIGLNSITITAAP